MNPLRIYRDFISARTTVVLLIVVALLLLLNVVLPQAAVIGEERFAAIVETNRLFRFLLSDLGLGRMPTSPVFLTALGLFFLNLLLVLLARIGPTWRRIELKPRSEKGLQAWARLEESLGGPLCAGWTAGHAAQTLRGFGYQVRRAGERTLWGVKHRTAPLGFLLFHLSFFLLCAGGMLIYYTRFVGSALLSEGQHFVDEYTNIERLPPFGAMPQLDFVLQQVEPRFEDGAPVHLGAVLQFRQGGSSVQRYSRINAPARWGTALLMVDQAGLAPVLWLQDERGFTVDRLVSPVRTRGDTPTEIRLAGAQTTVTVYPLAEGAEFPARADLPHTPLGLRVTRNDTVVFEGQLRQGEAARLDQGRLVLEELRYWVRVRVIAERGGAVLITGFVCGIAGLVWRLLWYRREIALVWDDRRFNMVGRSEFVSQRFQLELRSICEVLSRSPEASREAAT